MSKTHSKVFTHQDLINTGWNLQVNQISDYIIQITYYKDDYSLDTDRTIADPLTTGNNIVNERYNVQIDSTLPTINQINTSFINNTFIKNRNITFSFNATDTNPSKAELWINSTIWKINQSITWSSIQSNNN